MTCLSFPQCKARTSNSFRHSGAIFALNFYVFSIKVVSYFTVRHFLYPVIVQVACVLSPFRPLVCTVQWSSCASCTTKRYKKTEHAEYYVLGVPVYVLLGSLSFLAILHSKGLM